MENYYLCGIATIYHTVSNAAYCGFLVPSLNVPSDTYVTLHELSREMEYIASLWNYPDYCVNQSRSLSPWFMMSLTAFMALTIVILLKVPGLPCLKRMPVNDFSSRLEHSTAHSCQIHSTSKWNTTGLDYWWGQFLCTRGSHVPTYLYKYSETLFVLNNGFYGSILYTIWETMLCDCTYFYSIRALNNCYGLIKFCIAVIAWLFVADFRSSRILTTSRRWPIVVVIRGCCRPASRRRPCRPSSSLTLPDYWEESRLISIEIKIMLLLLHSWSPFWTTLAVLAEYNLSTVLLTSCTMLLPFTKCSLVILVINLQIIQLLFDLWFSTSLLVIYDPSCSTYQPGRKTILKMVFNLCERVFCIIILCYKFSKTPGKAFK